MKYSINGIRCTHSACTYVQLKRNILFWVEKCFWYKEVFVKCHFWSRRRTAAFFLSSAKNRGFLPRTVKRKYINYHVFLAYFSRYVSSYFLNCHMYMYMWVSRSGSGPTPPRHYQVIPRLEAFKAIWSEIHIQDLYMNDKLQQSMNVVGNVMRRCAKAFLFFFIPSLFLPPTQSY